MPKVKKLKMAAMPSPSAIIADSADMKSSRPISEANCIESAAIAKQQRFYIFN